MGRIFCFGCSFTGYWYPTWADILIEEAESRGIEGYNFGRSGAGNLYIALRIWEAHAKFKFTSDDHILVCWSGWNREDRWVNGRGWITPGNLAHQNGTYEKWFVEKYHDVRFCAMRDCAIISSTQLALKNIGVNVVQFSMAPFIQNNEYLAFQTFDEQRDIIETYNIQLDAPSMMEHIDTLDQTEAKAATRIKIRYTDWDPITEWHPLPNEHLDYVNNFVKDKISWLDNIEVGKQLADDWTTKLTSYKDAAPIDQLGWKSKTPKDLW